MNDIPAEVLKPVRDDIDSCCLSKEVMDTINDPKTLKVLSTTDEDGNPHTVYKSFMKALDDRAIIYVEMIYRSNTYKNMLRNKWANKSVSITTWNPEKMTSYQIKAAPVAYLQNGPLWTEMIQMVWSMFPEATPAGAWVLAPKEVINELYHARQEEEDNRILHSKLWRQYFGKQPKYPDIFLKKSPFK